MYAHLGKKILACENLHYVKKGGKTLPPTGKTLDISGIAATVKIWTPNRSSNLAIKRFEFANTPQSLKKTDIKGSNNKTNLTVRFVT